MPQLRRAPRGAFFAALLTVSTPVLAGSLRPSHAALVRQSRSARDAGFTYVEKDAQVHDLVRRGLLAAMRSNSDYYIHPDVRHAAARPETKVFVERLAQQYRDACGERLVVTSLVRPRSRQPWNSDPLSVHPTGMALDLRIPTSSKCRRWLEDVLLELEESGLIEAAREQVIPHYHIVVFPLYADYLGRQGVDVPATPVAVLLSSVERASLPVVETKTVVKKAATSPGRVNRSHQASSRRYKVRRGDNLWSIARRHGTTVAALRRANRVPKHLKPGQVLAIPAR